MKFESAVTAVLVLCALTTTGLVIRRELAGAAASPDSQPQKPVFLENWRDYARSGVLLGPPQAPVQLIEFADFECPFCASFHRSLRALREKYPTQVAILFIHYPLPGHRFAEPAARVADCAAEQDRFEAMHDRLFEHQHELGLRPWSEFAREAGIPDLSSFETCVASREPVKKIEDGRRLAEQLDVNGTPTVIINGWKLNRPPLPKELDEMVRAVLARRDPVQAAETD
jgi:protein-disulfide isomerase